MAKASVLDQIRALDEQKAKLMDEAKSSALANAQAAVAELNELGFNYGLTEGGTAPRTRAPSTGTRRSGIREDVLRVVTEAGADGIKKAALLEALGMKGDKSNEGAVSNALSNLKKDGKVKQAEGRNNPYIAA